MSTARRLASLFLFATLSSLGCRAQSAATQTPAALTVAIGSPLPPAISHRVEVLLREKAQLPPGATIGIGPVQASDVPGYNTIAVTFTSIEGKTSHPANFLLSTDGKTVAQFTKYDISADPRDLVSADGRPARGGAATAPVLIVGFDDLECPYCARLNASIFPAITSRYGDKVRVVYKDFPLAEIHPWAMRAAVDVNCLAAQSPAGYWSEVDYIHAHAGDIGSAAMGGGPAVKSAAKPSDKEAAKPDAEKADDKTLDRANAQLDRITREQGRVQKVDAVKLDACLAKQDTAAIDASKEVGTALDVQETPALFINGNKIVGAVPIEFIFNMIDDALRSENVTPPPSYVAPAK